MYDRCSTLKPIEHSGLVFFMPRPKHIALFGNFGSDNLGNEASFQSLLDFIRLERPTVAITGICYGPVRAQVEHHVDAIPLKLPFPQARWFRILNRISFRLAYPLLDFMRTLSVVRTFDAFLVPGTGILDDFSERWQAMPYDLFKWGIAARLARRPFAFVSVGAGPIKRPLSRWLMVRATRMARYRSYRDEASRQYMLKLRAGNDGDLVYPDVAFALPVPAMPSQLSDNSRPTIGVGVMQYHGWDRYSDRRPQIHDTYDAQMAQFVCWLINGGYRVRLLMGAHSDKTTFASVTKLAAEKLGIDTAGMIIADPADTLQELILQIQETEMIVATRYHNIVAALMAGKVGISIGYADKNLHLLAPYGLDRYSQHAEQLDVARLISQFSELMPVRHQYERKITAGVNRARELMREQYNHLLLQFL
jgi:polysaccharide pyruvyl transferase WcaK-like protein